MSEEGGRIFQRKSDNVFEIICGSWATEHIIDLVIDEFDLHKSKSGSDN